MKMSIRGGPIALGAIFLLGAIDSNGAVAASYQIVNHNHAATQGVLAVDSAGNLYGMSAPTSTDSGAVFELTVRSGYATRKQLYAFGAGGSADGSDPVGGVTLTPGDILLGTTSAGGIKSFGTVFTLGRAKASSLTVLHAFQGLHGQDGATPLSGLTAGAANTYYGTTNEAGGGDGGNVFSIRGSATNPHYLVIHIFGTTITDGIHPQTGRLAIDAQGRLFGTTSARGGTEGDGTVYMLEKVAGGWKEQVIYDFSSQTGVVHPYSGVVIDSQGELYGCAQSAGNGAIFKLAPPAQDGDPWQEFTVYAFSLNKAQGDAAVSRQCNLTYDAATNTLIGTTDKGGSSNKGALFTYGPLDTATSDTVVHSFTGDADGAGPQSPPLKVGNTYYGGNSTNGAIYAYTP